MPWLSPKFPSIHIKLTRSSAMSNLFRFIAALALVLAAADYFFSVFAALIDLFPSLPTLPSSYIYISSILVVCAYKLFSALPKLFNDDLGGLFFSVFAENISSRIISWIIDHFPVNFLFQNSCYPLSIECIYIHTKKKEKKKKKIVVP